MDSFPETLFHNVSGHNPRDREGFLKAWQSRDPDRLLAPASVSESTPE
jgi:hypothetical protein